MSEQNPANEQNPLSEPDAVRKDMRYSPGSDSEIQEKQDEPAESADPDIDDEQIVTLPGTGGPDDVGEVQVSEDDLNMPNGIGTDDPR